MKSAKRRRLEVTGWRVGSTAEFLDLTPEEAEFVDMKLALADHMRKLRAQRGWTQTEVARRLGSSQSRVAKMEAADGSVSLDLMVRSLLALGTPPEVVGRLIAGVA